MQDGGYGGVFFFFFLFSLPGKQGEWYVDLSQLNQETQSSAAPLHLGSWTRAGGELAHTSNTQKVRARAQTHVHKFSRVSQLRERVDVLDEKQHLDQKRTETILGGLGTLFLSCPVEH